MLRLAYRHRRLLHVPTITMLPKSQPRRATARLLAEDRQRVVRQLGAITADVFVETEEGPHQGRRQREFNKAWRVGLSEGRL